MAQTYGTDPNSGISAREIAQRNRESCGQHLSNIMKTAATARELAHGRAERGDA